MNLHQLIDKAANWCRPVLPIEPKKRGRPRIHKKKIKSSIDRRKIRRGVFLHSDKIIDYYKGGNTLEWIGVKYGVSRERIRQILAEHGVTGQHGGQAQKTAKKKAERKAKRDAKYLKSKGMLAEDYFMTPYKARQQFVGQRRNAMYRGIEWGLLYSEWWKIWEDSGKWKMRGRGKGYCMARKGDSGGYTKDNVYICTNRKNIQDGFINKPAHKRKSNPNLLRFDYNGESLTIKEIAKLEGVTPQCMRHRLKRLNLKSTKTK